MVEKKYPYTKSFPMGWWFHFDATISINFNLLLERGIVVEAIYKKLIILFMITISNGKYIMYTKSSIIRAFRYFYLYIEQWPFNVFFLCSIQKYNDVLSAFYINRFYIFLYNFIYCFMKENFIFQLFLNGFYLSFSLKHRKLGI